jgi:hypothetical protein
VSIIFQADVPPHIVYTLATVRRSRVIFKILQPAQVVLVGEIEYVVPLQQVEHVQSAAFLVL